MVIKHYNLESEIKLTYDKIRLLVIENPNELYKKVTELIAQSNGQDGNFIIQEDSKDINFSKSIEIITDLLNIDMNDKKILNLLYKKLETNFNSSELIVDLNTINTRVEGLLEKLFSTVSVATSTSLANIIDYVKIFDTKIENTYDTFLEKIICYINALVELKNVKLFVFVGAKGYLSDDEMKELLLHCEREKVYLLFIESSIVRKLCDFEIATVITEDLCEIVVKS